MEKQQIILHKTFPSFISFLVYLDVQSIISRKNYAPLGVCPRKAFCHVSASNFDSWNSESVITLFEEWITLEWLKKTSQDDLKMPVPNISLLSLNEIWSCTRCHPNNAEYKHVGNDWLLWSLNVSEFHACLFFIGVYVIAGDGNKKKNRNAHKKVFLRLPNKYILQVISKTLVQVNWY